MEVKKYHNFAINNGLIVHNCMDCIRYICQEVPYNFVNLDRMSYNSVKKFFDAMGIKTQPLTHSSPKTFTDVLKETTKINVPRMKPKRASGGFKL